MKKTIFLLVLIATLAACNFLRKKDSTHHSKLLTHKEAADTMRLASIDTSKIDSLTALIDYGYLNQQRSAELFKKLEPGNLLSSIRNGSAFAYNGFYGDDHYRIEFYISEANQDTANPFVINLAGKCKYKTNITDFTGKVNIDSVFAFRDFTYDNQEFQQYEANDSGAKFEGDTNIVTYHSKGTFVLNEDSNQANSGVFKGNFYMDFIPRHHDWLTSNAEVWYNTRNESRRGGFLFDGTWNNRTGTQTKPVIFAADLFMFANEILEDFSYGEREIEINKKYRALGWENYWEDGNNEWWVPNDDAKVMMVLGFR